MSKTDTPETDLIAQLTQIREALSEERATLLERVAAIDQALAVGTPLAPKAAPKAAKAPKATGIKEAIVTALGARPWLTIKEVQDALPDHAAKSVEATVRALAASGKIRKDDSNPRKFALPITLPAVVTNGKGSPKANGLGASV